MSLRERERESNIVIKDVPHTHIEKLCEFCDNIRTRWLIVLHCIIHFITHKFNGPTRHVCGRSGGNVVLVYIHIYMARRILFECVFVCTVRVCDYIMCPVQLFLLPYIHFIIIYKFIIHKYICANCVTDINRLE